MFVHEMVPVEGTAGLPMDTAALEVMISQLRDHGCTGDDDTERITQIGLLETLKSVAAAVQAVLTADFARSREAELARIATESVQDRARRDVGAQIGLARRVSPRVGTRLVGMAKVLTTEMPALMGAFRRGAVDEYQALLVVAETATLSKEHRQAVDTELAGRFGTLSARRAHTEAARIGYRLDPDQAVKRLRKGLADRRVTLRPAPDTMSYLTALLPATEGVAVLAALTNHAATATALGDPRGKGALMADELFTRLVQPGSPSSNRTGPTAGPGTGGPGTAGRGTAGPGAAGSTPTPNTGTLTRSDPRRRLFTHTDRQFLITRDQVCRTPWCDAPIRHADHTRPHATGGPTITDNGAGLCAACNHTKEHPGWTHDTADDGTILVTTPTGHHYVSRPPDPPRSDRWELVA